MVVWCYVENQGIIRFVIQIFQETTYQSHGNTMYLDNIIFNKSVSMCPRRLMIHVLSIPLLCGA